MVSLSNHERLSINGASTSSARTAKFCVDTYDPEQRMVIQRRIHPRILDSDIPCRNNANALIISNWLIHNHIS